MARCVICHKPLSKPESIQRGMGDICAAKNQRRIDVMTERGEGGEYINDKPPFVNGFIFENLPNNSVRTNLPHIVKVHTESGFNIGYNGSGPAETALNVLEYVVRRERLGTTAVTAWNGVKCTQVAWANHQDFKNAFIAGMSQEAGVVETIPYDLVHSWLLERVYQQAEFMF